ncbi:recombination protein NinB [Pantoea stewartii]|uniref:recombination protein NinB n=1 Tax=Pantoea stewartii TaxID=66269 RepID=UPI0025A19B17|nr:recombination protein NinB [Pantoea stewartii]
MEKMTFLLRNEQIRNNLIEQIKKLPLNDHHPTTVRISDFDRSLSQNSMFHALCGDVARQALWMQQRRTAVQWKTLFVSGHSVATGLGAEVVPGIEGEFCNIRESTAKMGIKRMNSLIEYSTAWAVGNGVRLRDVRYGNDYFGNAA